MAEYIQESLRYWSPDRKVSPISCLSLTPELSRLSTGTHCGHPLNPLYHNLFCEHSLLLLALKQTWFTQGESFPGSPPEFPSHPTLL